MKKSSVLDLIKEQAIFGFTGKINVLLGKNKQHVGEVIQLNGNLVNASFHGIRGKKALFNLLFEDIDGASDLVYVIEPELVDEHSISFEYDYDDFYKKLQTRFETYKKFKDLRPSPNLKLFLRTDFVKDIHGFSVGPEEFDTMLTILENSHVSAIYSNSDLYEYQITRALVSLRRKKALIVKE